MKMPVSPEELGFFAKLQQFLRHHNFFIVSQTKMRHGYVKM